MTRHIELERKYDVDPDLAIPDLREVSGCASIGAPETHTLRARYYDTEDLRLAARGITLRRRRGGTDAGWHLKLPVARNEKREIRVPLDAAEDTVPPDLAALVAAHARGRPLVPVAELDTRRIERGVLAEDGTVLAEVADDTVSARRFRRGGGEVGLLSWREIEVEAVEGSAEVLKRIGGRLVDSGARDAVVASKLERALEGDLVRVERPSGTRTAGELMMTCLAAQFEQLLAYDPLVRLADHDDDSVHKMRVSVRRLRSLLRTHDRLIRHDRIAPLDAELRWLADVLGSVRDLEVLNARFRGRLADLPGAGPSPGWLVGLATDEARARAEVRKELLTPRYFALLDAVDAFVAEPPLTDRAARRTRRETPRIVARTWRKMLRRAEAADRLPPGGERDAALHRTRKAAKRARYTAEAAALALDAPARKLARRAERLQDILGAHHDSVVARQRLAEIAERPGLPGEDVFVLGRLAEIERAEGVRVLERLPEAREKAAGRERLRALGKK